MPYKKIKAKKQFYKGQWYRSRLEARWAIFFDEMRIDYTYELDTYGVDDEINYCPDFLLHLPEENLYVEVKGDPGDKDIEKWEDFSKYKPLLVVGNIPYFPLFTGTQQYIQHCVDYRKDHLNYHFLKHFYHSKGDKLTMFHDGGLDHIYKGADLNKIENVSKTVRAFNTAKTYQFFDYDSNNNPIVKSAPEVQKVKRHKKEKSYYFVIIIYCYNRQYNPNNTPPNRVFRGVEIIKAANNDEFASEIQSVYISYPTMFTLGYCLCPIKFDNKDKAKDYKALLNSEICQAIIEDKLLWLNPKVRSDFYYVNLINENNKHYFTLTKGYLCKSIYDTINKTLCFEKPEIIMYRSAFDDLSNAEQFIKTASYNISDEDKYNLWLDQTKRIIG